MIKSIDLNEFELRNDFYPEIKLFISIKSFDLKAIRDRYLKNKNKKSNRTGSVERRKSAEGGIAEITIKEGKIVKEEILRTLKEPRGIDSIENLSAFSSENIVYLISEQESSKIYNPWFSYIHTVDFDKTNKNSLVVSSSGFDCLFEYSLPGLKKTFEWFAWENGFDHGLDPETGKKVFLTRNKVTSDKYNNNNIPHLFISDPKNQILPTSRRAAFINSVVYDPFDKNKLIATLFHEGAVYSINRKTGNAEKIISGLKNPHGGMKIATNSFMGTSTASGEVVKTKGNNRYNYDFSKLKGKPDFLGNMEWLQNSIAIDDLIITIDSNRNSFIIFNPEKKLCSIIPFDENWAVQDLTISKLTEKQKDIIKA